MRCKKKEALRSLGAIDDSVTWLLEVFTSGYNGFIYLACFLAF